MKPYQKLICYGLAAIGALGLPACSSKEISNPVYISGKVVSERYQINPIYPHEYFFSVETKKGLKNFRCSGDSDAPSLDYLINPNDEVKIELDPQEKPEKGQFDISKDQIVEVNGKLIRYKNKQAQ